MLIKITKPDTIHGNKFALLRLKAKLLCPSHVILVCHSAVSRITSQVDHAALPPWTICFTQRINDNVLDAKPQNQKVFSSIASDSFEQWKSTSAALKGLNFSSHLTPNN